VNPAILAAIDRQDEIAACWEVITDLMSPSDDLHCVNRDKLASAMYFLQTEYNKAREQLELAIKQA